MAALRHHRCSRRWRGLVFASLLVSACGSASTPTAPASTSIGPFVLDRATVIDALDYWSATAGISYVLLDSNTIPRLFLRPGDDGLGNTQGRGLIDGTVPGSNQAQSGLIVISSAFGALCSKSDLDCREIFRHEVGHGLGYLDEPPTGLMSGFPNTDSLSERERNMMIALYSLPLGASVRSDGTWIVVTTGASGQLSDLRAAQDVITYNINARSGSSFRTPGIICRWQLPVPVYFQR